MFVLTCLLQLCFARGLQKPEGDRFRYLEPRFKLAVTVLLGEEEKLKVLGVDGLGLVLNPECACAREER